jgi:hypothetical protein
MIRAGASPKALQVILGHQSAGFTLTVYGHIFEQDVAKLAERLEVVVAVTKSRPRPKEDGTTDDGAPRLRVVCEGQLPAGFRLVQLREFRGRWRPAVTLAQPAAGGAPGRDGPWVSMGCKIR